jgi:hypothetical protein
MSLDEIDPDFVERLIASEEVKLWVAGWLRARGWTVVVPDLLIRPDVESRREFADPGDLLSCFRPDGSEAGICEVKGRTFSFTPETFPFPTMIVGKVYRLDEIRPKSSAIVSLDRKWIGFVDEESRPRWSRRTRFYDGRDHEVYEAELVDVKWFRGDP